MSNTATHQAAVSVDEGEVHKKVKSELESAMQDGWDCGDYDDMLVAATEYVIAHLSARDAEVAREKNLAIQEASLHVTTMLWSAASNKSKRKMLEHFSDIHAMFERNVQSLRSEAQALTNQKEDKS